MITENNTIQASDCVGGKKTENKVQDHDFMSLRHSIYVRRVLQSSEYNSGPEQECRSELFLEINKKVVPNKSVGGKLT